MGVPMLRSLFNQVFGEPTASNNAGWLRRKLSESPDTVHGQRRSAVVRSRDSGAAIWNNPTPVVTPGAPEGACDHLDTFQVRQQGDTRGRRQCSLMYLPSAVAAGACRACISGACLLHTASLDVALLVLCYQTSK